MRFSADRSSYLAAGCGYYDLIYPRGL